MVIPPTMVNGRRRALFVALALFAAGTMLSGCPSDADDVPLVGTTVVPSTTTVGQALDEATSGGGTCVAQCDGKACGSDGCLGQCGVCDSGTTCTDGQCVAWSCQADCEDRECGDDGCGGSCGSCGDGEFCLPATGTCNVADPCEGVTFEGCCDGTTLQWCQAGALESLDCDTDGCGWADGEYNCGGVGSDPSGEFILSCDGTCDCGSKECGDDGCGNSCGDCSAGLSCDASGACVEDACQGITFDGCCNGDALTWCEGGVLEVIDCSDNTACGWSDSDGYYNCGTDGLEDPSGALPMDCGLDGPVDNPDPPSDECNGIDDIGCCDGAVLTWCDAGALEVIDCSDNASCGWSDADGFYNCGTDGSAEPSGDWPLSCGDVGGGCTPNCGAAQCGDDGCGGSCGTCGAGAECDTGSGMCISTCTPACDGKACGDDGCGGSCGSCGGGMACDEGAGTCSVPCAADCTGKQCGDDGCGNSCGDCVASKECSADGHCVAPDPCDGLTLEGCCDGQVVKWCEDDEPLEFDCAGEGIPACGWSADIDGYDCDTNGDPDPTGTFPMACE